MSSTLRISALKRRFLVQAAGELLEARALLERAALAASRGGLLLPMGASRKALKAMHDQLLLLAKPKVKPGGAR